MSVTERRMYFMFANYPENESRVEKEILDLDHVSTLGMPLKGLVRTTRCVFQRLETGYRFVW